MVGWWREFALGDKEMSVFRHEMHGKWWNRICIFYLKYEKKTGERKREEWKTNSDNVTQSSILLHKLAMWQTAREIVFSIKQYLVVGGWVWIRNRRKLQCMWRKERWSERERMKIREKIIFVQVVVSIGDTMTSIDSDKISI